MENLMAKEQAKVWEFESSSSSKRYQTIQYTDGYVSCNCPGWTRRAVRECKHTNMVHMGTADNNCVAMTDLMQKKASPQPVVQSVQEPEPVAPKKVKMKKKKKVHALEEEPAIARKIRIKND